MLLVTSFYGVSLFSVALTTAATVANDNYTVLVIITKTHSLSSLLATLVHAY